MKIKELHLQNFRGFEDLTIKFPKDNVAVFIGENGAGKSSVLDAIGNLFYAFTVQMNLNKEIFAGGFFLGQNDIQISKNSSTTEIHIDNDGENYDWKFVLTKGRGFRGDELPSNLFAKNLINRLDYINLDHIPIVLFSRSKSLKTSSFKEEQNFTQLASYDDFIQERVYDFQSFTTWFNEELNYENTIKVEQNTNYISPKLHIIRLAIELFLSKISVANFKNLRIKRERIGDFGNFIISLVISKNGKELLIEQLSSGEKSVLLLIFDIAKRLILANPNNANPLNGNGVVLIDEIDLHLHPQWQRDIVPALTVTFPNIQFIVTTHSPQVLSKVKRENIFILNDGKLVEENPYTYGRDVASILYEVFGVEARPKEIQKRLNECFRLLENEEFDKAIQIIKELTTVLGENDTDLMRAKLELELNV